MMAMMAMINRDWREYLMAGDVKNVLRYLDGGFDVNTDIGVVGISSPFIIIHSFIHSFIH